MSAALAGSVEVAPRVLRSLDSAIARDGRVWRSRGGVLLRFCGKGWQWSPSQGGQWSFVDGEAMAVLTSGPYVEMPAGREVSSVVSAMGV